MVKWILVAIGAFVALILALPTIRKVAPGVAGAIDSGVTKIPLLDKVAPKTYAIAATKAKVAEVEAAMGAAMQRRKNLLQSVF